MSTKPVCPECGSDDVEPDDPEVATCCSCGFSGWHSEFGVK